jgi:hypothetical protein
VCLGDKCHVGRFDQPADVTQSGNAWFRWALALALASRTCHVKPWQALSHRQAASLEIASGLPGRGF